MTPNLAQIIANINNIDLTNSSQAIKDLYTYLQSVFKDFQFDDSIDNLTEILLEHITNLNNPHFLTATQIGIDASLIGITSTQIVQGVENEIDVIQTNLTNHTGNTLNPHAVNYIQVGFIEAQLPDPTDPTGVATRLGLRVTLSDNSTLDIVDFGNTLVAINSSISNLQNQITQNNTNLQSQITSNTTNIATNTADIATNKSNISTNASNIATNTSSIATNTTNVSNLINRTLNTDGSFRVDPTLQNITAVGLPISSLQNNINTDLQSQITSHITNSSNPHGVTAVQLSIDPTLTNVSASQLPISNDAQTLFTQIQTQLNTNTSDLTNTKTSVANNTNSITSINTIISELERIVASLAQMNIAAPVASTSDITNPNSQTFYLVGTTSPYQVFVYVSGDFFQIGLFDGDTTSFVTHEEFTSSNATLQTSINSNTNLITALQSAVSSQQTTIENHIGNTTNPHGLTKIQIGLNNVQNVDTTNFNNISSGQISNFSFLPNTGTSTPTVPSPVSNWIGLEGLTLNNLLVNPTDGNGTVIGLPFGSSADVPQALTRTQLQAIIGSMNIANIPTIPVSKISPINDNNVQPLSGVLTVANGTVQWASPNISSFTTGSLDLSRVTTSQGIGYLKSPSSMIDGAITTVPNIPFTDITGNLPVDKLVAPSVDNLVLTSSGGSSIWKALPPSGLPVNERISFSNLPTSTTPNRVLTVGGSANSDPAFSQVDLGTMISGQLPLSNMSQSSIENRVLLTGGTANTTPQWGQVDLGTMVTGTLPISNIQTGLAPIDSPTFTTLVNVPNLTNSLATQSSSNALNTSSLLNIFTPNVLLAYTNNTLFPPVTITASGAYNGVNVFTVNEVIIIGFVLEITYTISAISSASIPPIVGESYASINIGSTIPTNINFNVPNTNYVVGWTQATGNGGQFSGAAVVSQSTGRTIALIFPPSGIHTSLVTSTGPGPTYMRVRIPISR